MSVLEKIRRWLVGQEENGKTAPLSEEQIEQALAPAPPIAPSQYLVGIGQSVGRQRERNEDTLFSMATTLSGAEESLPLGIFLIADGMGGHQNGDLASETAARVMANYLFRKLVVPYYHIRAEQASESVQEVLQAGVKEAQAAVVRHAPGGGTTLTAAFALGEQLTLAHVGDSRAYLFSPEGAFQQLSRDHTYVQRLQELGRITEAEAQDHPQRNVLYRAIGQTDPYEADINTYPFPRHSKLLLCSDGLWGVVPEAEVLAILRQSAHPALVCQQLVDAANTGGGPDNISVILIENPA